ncbi:FUSC family protein [Streptomyces violaceus]|uniref:FUSC family protein n=1 Tax=Streptomyces violaceus TaxID=1936 RepID=UPI003CD0AF5F
MFVNTASRGETLVRGFRRVFGTVIGIVVGLLVAVPLHGAPAPTAALVALCVFGIFYTAAVSYSWMMLAVTVMVSLLTACWACWTRACSGSVCRDRCGRAVCRAGRGLRPAGHHARHNDAWIRRALQCVHAAHRRSDRSPRGRP